jgi:hypothetical protein
MLPVYQWSLVVVVAIVVVGVRDLVSALLRSEF